MKKYLFLFLMICLSVSLPSCGDDDNGEDPDAWKNQNDEFIASLAFNPEYTRIASTSNAGSIYYKVLESGEGTEQIYYTSTVKVYYTGTMINGTVFKSIKYLEKQPETTTVSSKVDGFTTALMRMKVGDKWDVWVPYDLGYGASEVAASATTASVTTVTIPAYSALHYEIEVVEIVEQ